MDERATPSGPGSGDPQAKRDADAAPKSVVALRQIRESAEDLLKQGKTGETMELLFSALEAVLVKSRDQELLIAKLLRRRMDHKSERVDPNQLWLLVERMSELPEAAERVDVDQEAAEDAKLDGEIDSAEEAQPRPTGKRRKKSAGWQARGIDKQVHKVEPEPAERKCAQCGQDKKCIGHDVTRRLEYVPAHFEEHEYHLAKYACGTCKDVVTTAPAPLQVVERSAVTPSLLGHIVVSKMIDHQPLHRQSRGFARQGVDIPVSTLSDWMAAAGRMIQPLADKIAQRVLRAAIARTDATGLLVLDPTSPEHAVIGSMWCNVGDDRDVAFYYTPTGEGEEGPWKFYAGRKDYLQADAHNVFDRLFNGKVASAIEVGCWAHARRKLVALQDMDCRVAYPLKLIARLYRVEHLGDARRLSTTDRTQLRQERSVPILEKLKTFFLVTLKNEPPSTDLAKAVAYALNHWAALNRFVQDGRLSLDNNLCEQQLRDIACGRRNYLFAGSHDAARRAAALYSLTRTCIQYKVPPLPYFIDVFTKLAQGWSGDRLEQLLPHCWRTPSA